MRIAIELDEHAVAARAADLICDTVLAHPGARIGLPTGRTPVATYTELERRKAAGAADFSGVTVYAVDEFADATSTTAGTNSVFFREHLRLRVKALHCPDAGARYPDVHIRAFAAAIGLAGGLDLCVLGVGVNGHIAFNEPGSARDAGARVVELAEASRAAHAAEFGSIEQVPWRGMTLGVVDLLAARRVFVLATGAHKADVVRAAIEGAPSAEVPASWLQAHGDVTWLLDESAAAKLSRRG